MDKETVKKFIKGRTKCSEDEADRINK